MGVMTHIGTIETTGGRRIRRTTPAFAGLQSQSVGKSRLAHVGGWLHNAATIAVVASIIYTALNITVNMDGGNATVAANGTSAGALTNTIGGMTNSIGGLTNTIGGAVNVTEPTPPFVGGGDWGIPGRGGKR